jgi:hypothetical protein
MKFQHEQHRVARLYWKKEEEEEDAREREKR